MQGLSLRISNWPATNAGLPANVGLGASMRFQAFANRYLQDNSGAFPYRDKLIRFHPVNYL